MWSVVTVVVTESKECFFVSNVIFVVCAVSAAIKDLSQLLKIGTLGMGFRIY